MAEMTDAERPAVDAGEAGWMVKHDGRLILASFTETHDTAEWTRLRLLESYRKGEFQIVPVRIMETETPTPSAPAENPSR